MDDRCCTVPKHAGYNVLPNTPLFGRLLRYASRIPARIAVDDVCANLQRTHLELLSDVLALRHTVLDTLDRATCHALERKDEVYTAIVAAGGYEYTVAILAILALGAAAVPVEEAAYFIDKSRAALVLPVHHVTGVPTMYMRLRRYYQRTLSKRPVGDLAEYIAGAKQFRACLCGTSALPRPLDDFWSDLMDKPIFQRYGATEFGAVFKVRLDDSDVPEGSVGEIASGVDLKLSEEGEILVKSPHMFAKYLDDPEGTANAHDENGYFRTGDIARREGKYYFIVGRASLDIIKSGGYKISALDIERELLGLPYIAEAMVVGVADEEYGQRVAALVSLHEEVSAPESSGTDVGLVHTLAIEKLRSDLREKLAEYKLPTLLRIARGELPKTATGKVQKKILGPRFFPVSHRTCSEVQIWEASKERLAKL